MSQEEKKAFEYCRLLVMVGRQAGRRTGGVGVVFFCFVRLLYLDLDFSNGYAWSGGLLVG